MKKFLIILKCLCILLAISLYLGISLAYTDETGRYILTGLNGGNYTVYADSPYGTNLVGNSTVVNVRLGETSNTDIMLHEGGVITGKVTYVNGTGIANSSIKASGSDWSYKLKDVYTDKTGRYILTGLGDGNYTVYADSPYGTILAGNSTDVIVRLGETSNADIVLHEGGVITGKITYVNGTGIANSSIKASGLNWRYGPDWIYAYKDETGGYILTGLGGGNYTVYADSPYGTNLVGNSTDVIVRLGETSNADIVLHEGGVITGKVTYVNGTGIANSSIRASGSDWRYGPKDAYTDETGEYILTGLKDGNYTVYADSPYGTNLVGNSTDVIVRLGETSNTDIMLHEGGVITGKVTYVNGTGITNSSIKASGSDWRHGPKDAYTDEMGGYILTGLGGGIYTVYADSPYGTNLAGNSTDVIVRLGETSNADIVLHEGGIITGKVTYVNGTGIANSSIRASGSDWRYGPKDAYTDKTGRYILTGLSGGIYIVYADSPYGTNLVGNRTNAIVRLGETSNADIVLHEGGVITGKVTYVNGTGIANSSVEIMCECGGGGGGDFPIFPFVDNTLPQKVILMYYPTEKKQNNSFFAFILEIAALIVGIVAVGYFIGKQRKKPKPDNIFFQEKQDTIKELAKKFSTYQNRRSVITEEVIKSWLLQFDNITWIKFALRLLENIDYYEPWQMKQIFIHFYEKIIDENDRDKIVISLLGNPKDSSSIVNYTLGEEIMRYKLESHPLESILNSMNPDKKVIVFIDDNIGSGKQAVQIFREWFGIEKKDLNESHVKSLSNEQIQKFKRFRIYLCTFVGFEDGKDNVSVELKKMGLNVVKIYSFSKLEEEIGCFHKALKIFDNEEERMQAENMAREIGIQLFEDKDWPDEIKNKRSLGYGNSQKLIVFYYNTPTSTLPILWKEGSYDGKKWLPLFPRREKK